MNKRIAAGLFPLCAMLALGGLASAQNPCAEIGSDCRIMTASEVQAFKARVLAVQALLPVPDPARYVQNGAIEASTMPFVAATKIPGVPLTCRAFPAGAFSSIRTIACSSDTTEKPRTRRPPETKKTRSPQHKR